MDTPQPLWPGRIPGSIDAVGPETDITRPDDDRVAGKRLIRLGNVSQPAAQVFLPPVSRRKGSAVVILPGGGFHILAWDLEGTEVATWLNGLGIAAIVVKYRVPSREAPNWRGPAMDAQRALSWTRSQAAGWGVRPDRIGILGFSAGGKTAAMAALACGRRLYDPADAIDRQPCHADFAALIYPAYLVDERGQLLPEVAVTKEAPPNFFAHAADDSVTCQSSLQLCAALRQNGVAAELHLYESGGHGYGLRPQKDKLVTTWPKRCEDWLKGRGLL